MNENRILLYDSNDTFSNDIIEELKNNNILSTFSLIDKSNCNPVKLHVILRDCLFKCELPTLIIPNITTPIERNHVRGWIKTIAFFNIKTNSIKNKEQKLTEPSPQDKLGIAKQEITKISDSYTFIDEKNTDKLFQIPNKNELILNENTFSTKIVDQTQPEENITNKKRVLNMLRGKK
jgi:hypothetical protein